jgi:hypothetical protein
MNRKTQFRFQKKLKVVDHFDGSSYQYIFSISKKPGLIETSPWLTRSTLQVVHSPGAQAPGLVLLCLGKDRKLINVGRTSDNKSLHKFATDSTAETYVQLSSETNRFLQKQSKKGSRVHLQTHDRSTVLSRQRTIQSDPTERYWQVLTAITTTAIACLVITCIFVGIQAQDKIQNPTSINLRVI